MRAAYGAEFRQGAIDVARRGEASVTQVELLDQVRRVTRADLATRSSTTSRPSTTADFVSQDPDQAA